MFPVIQLCTVYPLFDDLLCVSNLHASLFEIKSFKFEDYVLANE